MVTEFTNLDGTVVAVRLRMLKAKGRQFTTIGSFGSSMFGLAQADVTRALMVVEGEIDAECVLLSWIHQCRGNWRRNS